MHCPLRVFCDIWEVISYPHLLYVHLVSLYHVVYTYQGVHCKFAVVLLQYEMDEEKVANLLQIPLYFDLEIYVASRQEKVSVCQIAMLLLSLTTMFS